MNHTNNKGYFQCHAVAISGDGNLSIRAEIKIMIFYMNSSKFYIKTIDLDMISNFILDSFFIWDYLDV